MFRKRLTITMRCIHPVLIYILNCTAIITRQVLKYMKEEYRRYEEIALVMTSIDEFRRPIEKVSPSQSGSLAATGFIWTRYCLVIKPINYSLSICNFSLGLANAIQCFRAYSHQKNKPVEETVAVNEAVEVQNVVPDVTTDKTN